MRLIANMTQNYHILELKYLPATNTKGTRLKIKSHRFKDSTTIHRDYQYDNFSDQAIDFLTEKGFNIIGKGEVVNSDILITDTFDSLTSHMK